MWHSNNILRTFCLLLIGTLCACKKDCINTCDSVITNSISDQELIDTVLNSEFKYYQGFYTENLDSGHISFVRTINIDEASADLKPLCTDDFNTALNWSEQSANNSLYYRDLVSSSENEKYFEFRRVRSTNPSDVILNRVFKCSYLDFTFQEEVDDSNWILGTFNQRPITEDNCKELVEFLNFINSYNYVGEQFISFDVCETSDWVQVTLFETLMVYNDTPGNTGYTEIYLFQNTYTVSKDDGLLRKNKKTVKHIY